MGVACVIARGDAGRYVSVHFHNDRSDSSSHHATSAQSYLRHSFQLNTNCFLSRWLRKKETTQNQTTAATTMSMPRRLPLSSKESSCDSRFPLSFSLCRACVSVSCSIFFIFFSIFLHSAPLPSLFLSLIFSFSLFLYPFITSSHALSKN